MIGRLAAMGLAIVGALGGGLAVAAPAGASAVPAAVVTPSLGGHDINGETIRISVGPNSLFTPNARIEVLECAAPHGMPPTNDGSCDGNTAAYGSIIVAADGSFTVPGYTLVALPNAALDEGPHGQPVCNLTAACVLYIGQNQNDFSAPKIFSALFRIDPSTPTPAVFAGSVVAGGTAGGAGTAGGRAEGGGAGGGSTGSSAPEPTRGGADASDHGDVSAAPARARPGPGGHGNPWLWGSLASVVLLAIVGLVRRGREVAR